MLCSVVCISGAAIPIAISVLTVCVLDFLKK